MTTLVLLAIDPAVVKDLTHFTNQPTVQRSARANVARWLEHAGHE